MAKQWLHALVAQEVPKRLIESRVAVHDQVLFVIEKRLHIQIRFLRCIADDAQDAEQVERCVDGYL